MYERQNVDLLRPEIGIETAAIALNLIHKHPLDIREQDQFQKVFTPMIIRPKTIKMSP